MDPALILITTLRMMRDYQQTIDSLLAQIAELTRQLEEARAAPAKPD